MSAPDLFSADTGKVTPMMAQYLAVRAAHPESLLFYRMGDFYELFFDDAVAASRTLDIALTKRGQHQGQDVPMCGVPVHSHTSYVARLIRAGYRVAICEQTETPEQARKRGSKALVERQVIRIITPGTLTEDTLLDARSNNFILAVVPQGADGLALACADLSTGVFEVETLARQALGSVLGRLCAREIVLPQPLAEAADIRGALADAAVAATELPLVRFDAANCRQQLLAFFDIATTDAWGELSTGETTAAGALIAYLLLTQIGARPFLRPPVRRRRDSRMEIDAATRRNLELVQTVSGETSGSLLGTIDATVTAAGARMLAAHLSAPLTRVPDIVARHDAVAFAVGQETLRNQMRDWLRESPDMERALSRLALGRGGPRDLMAIREALRVAQQAYIALDLQGLPAGLARSRQALTGFSPLMDELRCALSADPPLFTRDGGFIAPGYDAALDEQRTLRDEGRRLIAALQARYGQETALATLKVKHNNIIGYHVEVSAQQAEKLFAPPLNATFIHRQTMAGAVRFTTTELAQLERDLSQAADRALAIEIEKFVQLTGLVMGQRESLAHAAAALAAVDVTFALAETAVRERWCRPQMEEGTAFAITGGRHPVVEASLKAQAGPPFIANDCHLDQSRRLWLLTGPNMAGKSTFLRQNALIAILAQMGSFVPAAAATIGVVDRVFSRVGAADDLARGRSTFMVEMVETATILNLATPRSLVILDEIGRGTATYDGLSIAWAVVEHIHNLSLCRALFATHYHELTALAVQLPSLHLACLQVKDWQGDVVFLHQVAAGAADRSYGLHVAKLAGLPATVLKRAGEILAGLESSRSVAAPDGGRSSAPISALPPLSEPLVGAQPSSSLPSWVSAIEQELAQLNPDELTPRASLELLYRLKRLRGE